MTAEQKADILSRVFDDIVELEERIPELEESTKPIAPDKGLGRLTRLDAMQDKSVREVALRQAREQLTKLKYVLSQLDRPGFGTCGICGKEIPPERLLVVPHANVCVGCIDE